MRYHTHGTRSSPDGHQPKTCQASLWQQQPMAWWLNQTSLLSSRLPDPQNQVNPPSFHSGNGRCGKLLAKVACLLLHEPSQS